MSTNLNYKQVANVERRTWDAETYEKKAKARQEAVTEEGNLRRKGNDDNAVVVGGGAATDEVYDQREEFRPAEKGSVGPEGSNRAFLKARKDKVEIDTKVGTTELISTEQAATTASKSTELSNKDVVVKNGVGWHCKVCDCFLKDSHTYLDHINGRKHQRKLGFSMRVERSTKDQLLNRLSQLSKKKEEAMKPEEAIAATDFNDVVKLKDEEEERRKQARRDKRKERKKRLQNSGDEHHVNEDEEEEQTTEEVNPDLAAIMGFSGFGGT